MGRKERRFQARIAEARKKDFYKKKMDKENKKKKEEKNLRKI